MRHDLARPRLHRAQQTCSRSADLGNGITASSHEVSIVGCVRLPDGGLGCDCSTTSSVGRLRFDVDRSSDRSVCTRLLGACRNLVALEVEGPVSCTAADVLTSGESCNAHIDCTQQGMLGDESVVAHGSMFTSCSIGPDLAYSCHCNGGTDQAALEVDADDPVAACELAAMECPKRVEPTIEADQGYRSSRHRSS